MNDFVEILLQNNKFAIPQTKKNYATQSFSNYNCFINIYVTKLNNWKGMQ